jgi:probable F420-dependent oxidoreductase
MASRSLTGIGVWSAGLRFGDRAEAADAAAELDELGYAALWIPDVGGPVFDAVERLLRATKRTTVATGILNLWMHSAAQTAAEHAQLTGAYGDRFLVGIGASHESIVNAVEPGRYGRPLAATRDYLDALDAAPDPLAPRHRVLAALGPKMLALAAARSAGVHPYNVTPQHTAVARETVGPGGLVLPEQAVVLSTDPTYSRELGRRRIADSLLRPNYVNSWRRLGFDDDDFAGGGSDALIDGLIAWGDESAIAARVREHQEAGADHVCLQVLSDDAELPRRQWRDLAAALIE